MKITVILTIVCAFLFWGVETTTGDEISDLKKQLEVLQQKLEDLEKKQAEQAQEAEKVSKSVDKLKKQPSAREVVTEQLSKRVTVGGHFKFFLADQSIGEVSTATLDKDKQRDSFAAGVSNLWLYFNKQLNDWLSITVAPEIIVEAAATPVLGANITRSGSANVDVALDWGYLTARLPWQLELKAGAFYPYFSEEYASKIWWDEQYNGNPGLLTLQSWKSAGLELYRNFDFENFSLPVYLYYLNGEDRGVIQDKRYTDNNSAKNGLLHVAPEFYAYGARVKLLGSFGWGKWDSGGDNQSIQWATGADIKYGSFGLSGEYMYRGRDKLPLLDGGTEDGEDKGWYVKGIYTFNPQWRLVLKYSDVDLWSPGTDMLLTDNYRTMYGSINFFITESSIIIPEISYVKMDRSGSPNKTDYFRYTLGWRTTF
jgi:regulator of replication initiation timing